MDKQKLARMIDHTILKQEATKDDVLKICKEALENNFASVCVNPYYVSLVAEQLKDSEVKVCSVIGFPLGMNTIQSKVFETKEAVANGATEIDMVINAGQIIDGKYDEAEKEVAEVVKAAGGNVVKVIFETCLLTDEQIEKLTKVCVKAGAHFVKTSTGFSKAGATAKHVSIMSKAAEGKCEVKASGGIRTLDDAKLMIECGANRLGLSASVSIINNITSNDTY